MKTETSSTTIGYSRIKTVNVYEGGESGEPLSFDNPDMEALKTHFPDLKVYGPDANIPKPLRRIVTEAGGWVELAEGLEVPGGVIYREFSIYGRRQDTALVFIPGVKLKAEEDGFYRIIPAGSDW